MKIHLGSVLVCLLVSSAMGQKGSVSFWHKNFTMTCPWNGTWYKGDLPEKFNTSGPLELQYDDMTKGYYYCQLENQTKYHFYVKAKVCDNCYELDPALVIGAICVDFLVTLGVILLVYFRSGRTKSARATPKSPKKVSSASAVSSAPTTSPTYEALTREAQSEGYSTVHRLG